MSEEWRTTEAIIDHHEALVSVDGPTEPDGQVMATVIEVPPNWFGIKSGDRPHFAKFGGNRWVACWD